MGPELSLFMTYLFVFFLAFLVESIVEATLGLLFEKINVLKPYKWALQYVSFVVGIMAAFVYGLDFFAIYSKYFPPTYSPTIFGTVLSGLSIGRGSQFIHDMASLMFLHILRLKKEVKEDEFVKWDQQK